jgi:hypothetical protein
MKHALKRWCERMKSQQEVFLRSKVITGGLLRSLLVVLSYPKHDLDEMSTTGFMGAVRVPPVVALLRAVASFAGRSPYDFWPRAAAAWECRQDLHHGFHSQSNSAQPSTNIHIQCHECGTKPIANFFWKYTGMMADWQHAHKTKKMPAELPERLEISKKERKVTSISSQKAAALEPRKESALPPPPRLLLGVFQK